LLCSFTPSRLCGVSYIMSVPNLLNTTGCDLYQPSCFTDASCQPGVKICTCPQNTFSKINHTVCSHLNLECILTMIERTVFTFLFVAVSILIPESSCVIVVLGSFFAFTLCVIGPVWTKSALARQWGVWDALLLVVAVIKLLRSG